jgi:hypothetical protein
LIPVLRWCRVDSTSSGLPQEPRTHGGCPSLHRCGEAQLLPDVPHHALMSCFFPKRVVALGDADSGRTCYGSTAGGDTVPRSGPSSFVSCAVLCLLQLCDGGAGRGGHRHLRRRAAARDHSRQLPNRARSRPQPGAHCHARLRGGGTLIHTVHTEFKTLAIARQAGCGLAPIAAPGYEVVGMVLSGLGCMGWHLLLE